MIPIYGFLVSLFFCVFIGTADASLSRRGHSARNNHHITGQLFSGQNASDLVKRGGSKYVFMHVVSENSPCA